MNRRLWQRWLFSLVALLACSTVAAAPLAGRSDVSSQQQPLTNMDYTQFVLPFTGTQNGGNMFPGVTRPFGVVKLGPDMSTGVDAYSGYLPTGNITGFSMLHESGTGGAPKYGVVSQMPVAGAITDPLANLSVKRTTHDIAQVGYYKSDLSSGIVAELAATEHAGSLRYTFAQPNSGSVLVDVSHVLPSYRGMHLGQNYTGGNITIAQDGHYEGSGSYNNGWNMAPEWTIYFCGYFDTPHTSAVTFRGSNSSDLRYPAAATEVVSSTANGTQQPVRLGAVYTFANVSVTSRIGVSWISAAKACRNVNSEIPAATDLNTVVSATKEIWNTQLLGKVTTTETNTTNLQLLYTMLYGMMLLPSNRTGENPGWVSSEPYYDDLFTVWDLFRCQTALFQIVQPRAYEEYIRSLIDVYRHDGWLPDARSSNYNGRTQGGSNADNVLADAYVKGVRGQVNWADGYAAMVKDAETIPPNTSPDPESPRSSDREGRGALPDWLKYSYITPKYSRAVSRAVDYSLNDFALSQVATGLHKTDDARKYMSRSRNWRNHWNPKSTSLNFTGFLASRWANGSFVHEDPLSCSGCYWRDAFYEATPWEYSFSAYHDVGTLIKLCGGAKRFVEKLSMLFKPGQLPKGNDQFQHTIFNPGNEPSFASPYLFNFAQRQDLSVKYSRSIASSYYHPTPEGLPGNSDAGAMQSWALWNMIGLYPLTGTTTFLIGSPWFEKLSINLDNGHTFTVTSTGREAGHYVQHLKVNGRPWTKSWVTWNDVFAKGGTMEFVLGANATDWATGPLPPSPASHDVFQGVDLSVWLATGDM